MQRHPACMPAVTAHDCHMMGSGVAGAQAFYPTQVFVAGVECHLRISLDLNLPIPSVLPNGTLIESTEQPISATLGQVRLIWLLLFMPTCLEARMLHGAATWACRS